MKFTPERLTSTVWQRATWIPWGYRTRGCSSSGCLNPTVAILRNRTDGASRAPRESKTIAFCMPCLRRAPPSLYPVDRPPPRPAPSEDELDEVAAANARAIAGAIGFRRIPF